MSIHVWLVPGFSTEKGCVPLTWPQAWRQDGRKSLPSSLPPVCAAHKPSWPRSAPEVLFPPGVRLRLLVGLLLCFFSPAL